MKSLAELEHALLRGPLEAVTPETFAAAQTLVDGLLQAYFRRVDTFNAQWKPPAKPLRRRKGNGQFAADSREIPFNKIGREITRLAGDISGIAQNTLPLGDRP
jgi:hypothetical protein